MTRRCPTTSPLRFAIPPALVLLLLPALLHAAVLEATSVTLKNGLRVLLAPDSFAVAVDAALWFSSGPRHERPSQAGTALLAARLAFRNGADDPLASLEAEGGTGNLVVTPDLTSYSATLPAEGLNTALDFLAARLRGQPFLAADLAGERTAIRAERERGDRPPVSRALARLWAAAWPGHPYAQAGTAGADAGDAVGLAGIHAWRSARLAPATALLTLTGAFDPDSALAAIRRRFERLPRSSAASAGALAPPRTALRASERFDSPVRLCLVGWRGPGASDADAAALELLAAWLGGGTHSKLAGSLVRDWRLAITAQAGFSAQKEGSLLWTLVVVQPGADSAAVERTLLDAAAGATTQAIETFELERARRQVESAACFGLQTARQRGQALGEADLIVGDAAWAGRRLEALRNVTPEDIRSAAARVMTTTGRATVWLLPVSSGGGR